MVRPCGARGFLDLAVRSCINVSGLSLEPLLLPTIMDISAHATFLADRPRPGHLGHQCSHAPGRPILHRRLILSQTSAGKLRYVIDRLLILLCAVPLFVPGGRSYVPTCGPRTRRAQGPSRLAVAQAPPLASMLPGHALYGPEHGARITLDGMLSHRS